MAEEWKEKLHSVMEWTGWICGITGKSILGLGGAVTAVITFLTQKISQNPELTIIACCIAIIVTLILYIIIQKIKCHRRISEMNKRISAGKKAIRTIDKSKLEGFTPVDYYLIDKDAYDEFKTKLKISKCLLEVIFVKNEEDSKEYDFKFRWSLKIKNPSFKPQNMARFIYSGARPGEEEPRLMIDSEDITISNHGELEDKRGLGDDRFEEIEFSDSLKRGKEVNLTITYVFRKYKFNRNRISIWLVPDALGFADLDNFCIRFYSDGEIVHSGTEVTLQSYRLDAEYKPERKRTPEYEEFKNHEFEGIKAGFKARNGRGDKLHGYGYRLKLMNHEI